MKKRFLAFFALLLAISSFAFAQDEETGGGEKFKRKFNPDLQREFHISVPASDYDINPHTATYSSEARILNAVYEGLFSYNFATCGADYGLCREYKISRDKLRWTFTLRDNAFFSDGEKITAESVKQSWLRLFKTKGAPYASLLDCIKNVSAFMKGECPEEEVGLRVRNENTLVVELETPTAHLPNILCHHAFSVVSEKEDVFSGAFVIDKNEFVNTEKELKITLVKNEKFWDAENVALPKIIVSGNNDLDDAAWSFNAGFTDWASSNFKAAKIMDQGKVIISPEFGTEYIFFTCKNEPWKSSPELRQALLTAVPWKDLRRPYLIPATTLIYPINGYSGVEGLTETDPEEAVELMEKFRKNAGLGTIAEGEKLKILFGISESEYLMNFAQILKDAWEPLGVELQVQKTPASRYLTSLSSWNADLFVYSWVGDFADPVAFLELFKKGSSLSECRWDNEEFSKFLQDASMQDSLSERYAILKKAEQLLLDSAIVLPVSHNISVQAIDLNEIGGWAVNTLDVHPFKDIYFKEVERTFPKGMVFTKF